MKNSAISWTHHTMNPWIGCTRVSPGCLNCYADTLNRRWGKDLWGPGKERQRTSDAYWRQPLAWDLEAAAAGERKRVFCASMADVFDDAAPDAWRISLIGLMQITQNLDWLLLTKRPHNIDRMFYHFPFVIPNNIWLGTSVEDQARADERIPVLLDCGPCAVRFLSCEPLLGPIDLTNLHNVGFDALYGVAERSKKIDWVIIGGESGPRCRPMNIEWARGIVAQCRAANIPVWVKQLGGYPNKREALLSLPEDLRIRELPR